MRRIDAPCLWTLKRSNNPQRMIRLTKKEKLIKVSIALTTLTVYLQKLVHSFCANRNRRTKCTVLNCSYVVTARVAAISAMQYQHQVEGNVTGSSCFFSRSRKSRARGGCNAPSIRKCSTNIGRRCKKRQPTNQLLFPLCSSPAWDQREGSLKKKVEENSVFCQYLQTQQAETK